MASKLQDSGGLLGELIELAEAMIAQGARRRNPACTEEDVAAAIDAWYGQAPMPLAGVPGFRVRALPAHGYRAINRPVGPSDS